MAKKYNNPISQDNVRYAGRPDSEGYMMVVLKNGWTEWVNIEEAPAWLRTKYLPMSEEKEFSFFE